MQLIYYFFIVWFFLITIFLVLSLTYDFNKYHWSEEKNKQYKIFKSIFTYMINITIGLILLFFLIKSDKLFRTNVQLY